MVDGEATFPLKRAYDQYRNFPTSQLPSCIIRAAEPEDCDEFAGKPDSEAEPDPYGGQPAGSAPDGEGKVDEDGAREAGGQEPQADPAEEGPDASRDEQGDLRACGY